MNDFVMEFAENLIIEPMMLDIERFNVTLEVSFSADDRIYGAYLAMSGKNDRNQNVEEMLNITQRMRQVIEVKGDENHE